MKRLFTQKEIEQLEKNIYTYSVSETMIKFTDDFRDDFWRLYLTDMLGTKRTEVLSTISEKTD